MILFWYFVLNNHGKIVKMIMYLFTVSYQWKLPDSIFLTWYQSLVEGIRKKCPSLGTNGPRWALLLLPFFYHSFSNFWCTIQLVALFLANCFCFPATFPVSVLIRWAIFRYAEVVTASTTGLVSSPSVKPTFLRCHRSCHVPPPSPAIFFNLFTFANV